MTAPLPSHQNMNFWPQTASLAFAHMPKLAKYVHMPFFANHKIDLSHAGSDLFEGVPLFSVQATTQLGSTYEETEDMFCCLPAPLTKQMLQGIGEERARIAAFHKNALFVAPTALEGEQSPFLMMTRQIMQKMPDPGCPQKELLTPIQLYNENSAQKLNELTGRAQTIDLYASQFLALASKLSEKQPPQGDAVDEDTVFGSPDTWLICAVTPFHFGIITETVGLPATCGFLEELERSLIIPRIIKNKNYERLENSYGLHYSHWQNHKEAPPARLTGVTL